MKTRGLTILALLAACWPLVAAAQLEVRIGELSPLDRQFMIQQRELIADLAASKLGRSFNGDKASDLETLQALLDRRLVRADQTRELQAMGLIMGDLLAEELDMHWVSYEDKVGRSRALRYRETDSFLFPMTMISRRVEVGGAAPVVEIYDKACATIRDSLPPAPFQ